MLLEWFCGSLLTQRLVQLRHLRVVPACCLGLVAGRKKEGNQESSWELSSCHERLKKGPGWPWEQAPQCLQTLGLLHASEHTPLTAPRS